MGVGAPFPSVGGIIQSYNSFSIKKNLRVEERLVTLSSEAETLSSVFGHQNAMFSGLCLGATSSSVQLHLWFLCEVWRTPGLHQGHRANIFAFKYSRTSLRFKNPKSLSPLLIIKWQNQEFSPCAVSPSHYSAPPPQSLTWGIQYIICDMKTCTPCGVLFQKSMLLVGVFFFLISRIVKGNVFHPVETIRQTLNTHTWSQISELAQSCLWLASSLMSSS